MNRQQHGMLSLVFFSLSVVIGLFSIGQSSVLLAILYLCVLGLSGFVIVFSFCARCMCRNTSCGHVIPGMLTGYLPRRMSGRYSREDRFGFLIPAVGSLVYPQYWLVNHLWWLVAFWILFLIGMVETRTRVCRGCQNRHCMITLPPPVQETADTTENKQDS
jgi:hypothetical protein